MAAIEVIYGESGWFRLTVPTMAVSPTTEISAITNKYDFLECIKCTPTFLAPASVADTETKYHTTTVANGNRLSLEDRSKNYNAYDGSEISEDTTASTYESVEVSVTATLTNFDALVDAFKAGSCVFGQWELGKVPSTGAVAEYHYIFGNITDLKVNQSAGPSTIDFTITGNTFGANSSYTLGSGVDYTDFNSTCTGAGATVTPLNDGSARTITAITTGDFTATMGIGKILRK